MRNVPLCLVALLALWFPLASAQNAKIDSLKRVVETAKVDTVKARALGRLAQLTAQRGMPDSAFAYARKGLKLSEAIADDAGVLLALGALADAHYRTGAYDSARACRQRTLSLYERRKEAAKVAESHFHIGGTHSAQGNFKEALKCYQQALAIHQSLKESRAAGDVMLNLGVVYSQTGDCPKAVDWFQKALRVFERFRSDDAAVALGNLANVYMMQGDIDRALEYQLQNLRHAERGGDPTALAIALNNVGGVYFSKKDYPKAIDYFERSLKIKEESGDLWGSAFTLGNLGLIHREMRNLDEAHDYTLKASRIFERLGDQAGMGMTWSELAGFHLLRNQPQRGKELAEKALKISQEIGHLQTVVSSAETLSRIDSALGDWKGAYFAQRVFKQYADSLKNDEKSKELGRLESEYAYEKQAEAERQRVAEDKRLAQARANWMLGSAGGGLLLLLVIAFTLYQGRRKEKKANAALRVLNEEIAQQKAEIEAMNAELTITLDEVNQQRDQLQEQHAKIEDSIRYASRIQRAILPSDELLAANMPQHFIHYQPKDIVSGDFYWMTRVGGKTYFATVDCTGHGVPGAFMSVLGSNLLHQIVDENQITAPDRILAELDRRIAETLHQQFGGDSKDGMDLALIVLHEAEAKGTRIVDYAGAGRPLWLWSAGEITEHKSARYSCGGSQHESKIYPALSIEVRSGDRLYLFSDGVVDQFGGPNGRKLGSVQLQAFLAETANLPIEEQGAAFAEFFKDWMKAKKQLDDVLLAGVAV